MLEVHRFFEEHLEAYLPQLVALQKEFLSDEKIASSLFINAVRDRQRHLFGVINTDVGTVVATGVVHINLRVGRIENVVVREESRRQGNGRLLMKRLHAAAWRGECLQCQLTPRPEVTEFYRKLQYEQHGKLWVHTLDASSKGDW